MLDAGGECCEGAVRAHLFVVDEAYLSRFGGIGRLYGAASLPKLARAHAAVIGVGGVGSWVVEALVRSGIGRATMIDLDDVCVTNTNRQLPATASKIGLPKVQVLAERARDIHPQCEVNAVAEFLTDQNAERLLQDDFDVVVDAVDRMSIKALIIAGCTKREIPVITVGAAGGRREPTLIKTADLGLAGRDELLQQVRRKLRRDYDFPKSDDGNPVRMGVKCVFSTEKPWFPWKDGTCAAQPETGSHESLRLDCASGFGAATFVTGAFGFVAAAEAVRLVVEAR